MAIPRHWPRRPTAALLIAALGWPSTAGATNRAAPEGETTTERTPETTTEPGGTAKPDANAKPATERAPETTTEPGGTAKPDATAKPETTVEPRPESTPQDLAPNEAKQHWQEGKRLYDNGRYPEAAEEFERSYAAVPAAATLYSVGLSYERAGKPVEAVRAFTRYLAFPDCAELPPDVPKGLCTAQRPEAEQALAELRPRVGRLALSIGDGVRLREVKVDGRTVPLDDFPLLLAPGTVDVEVFGLEPNERRSRPVSIAGGELSTLYIAPFEPEAVVTNDPIVRTDPPDDTVRMERRRRGLAASFWTGAGLTAASGIALAVTGGLALYHQRRFASELCPEQCWEMNPDGTPKRDEEGNIEYLDRPYPADHEAEFMRYRPIANAFVGVTVGLAVATALVGSFAFRRPPAQKRSGERQSHVRTRRRAPGRPLVRWGGSGLVVRW